jgi:hypothetical protein
MDEGYLADEVALQNLFYRAVYQKDRHSIAALGQRIIAPKDLIPADSIAIYRGSIIGNLSQTLASTYPVCCQLVGEKFFGAMAVQFIDRFPCTSPNLGDYGVEFPRFLASFEPIAHLSYLPDVARLEWHWHKIFSSEDVQPLDLEKLGAVPQQEWENLIFSLAKNAVLLKSVYPIHRIWQVNQPDYQGDQSINLEEGGIRILLWRQAYEMHMDFPTESEWELLSAFQAKAPFGQICQQLSDTVDVESLFPLFVQRGWITCFALP